MSRTLTALRHGSGRWESAGAETIVTVDRLRQALASGRLFGHLFRYRHARILTHRLETIGRPLKLALFLRVLSHGRCSVDDESGRSRPLSIALIARWMAQAVGEPFAKPALLSSMKREAAALVAAVKASPARRLQLKGHPLYLRTDLSFGLKAGGSVGHTAGVVNHLGECGGAPIMVSTDIVPTVNPSIEVHTVAPAESYWEYPELPSMVMNRQFEASIAAAAGPRLISFVYQRYSVNNFSGAKAAVARGIPFVLEYNGSEIWMSRHWGSPLAYETLSEAIELANFDVADLIVVVSQAMADELVSRGVDGGKILVNPNGVEPDRYSPSIDGAAVRRQYGLEGRFVIGFIGTFGPWHGAEVLARAFGRLIAQHPKYRANLRLLMIGDGVRMPDVVSALEQEHVRDLTVLTGIVPQADGPRHLAACDVLASPHVPNADGTPFFGSPTKLFEYMAMGKPIVASELDQVGDILEHGRAARMVRPGDVDSLVDGLHAIIEDRDEGRRLGEEARRLAVARHSWREHTRRIVAALSARVPVA